MNQNIFKNILPVVAGTVTGGISVAVGQRITQQLFPMPEGLDFHNKEALRVALAAYPVQAYVAILVVYALASAIGGLVATLLSGRRVARPSIVVGIVLTVMGIVNDLKMPQPVWFSLANLLVYLPLAFCGYLLVRKNAAHKTAA